MADCQWTKDASGQWVNGCASATKPHAFWRTVSNWWRFCPYCGKALHLSSAEDK